MSGVLLVLVWVLVALIGAVSGLCFIFGMRGI